MGSFLEERTIVTAGARSQLLALLQAAGVFSAALGLSILGDAPAYWVLAGVPLGLVVLSPRSLDLTTRSLIYALVVPAILAFFLNLLYPINADRFFFPAAEYFLPYLLGLAIGWLFLAQDTSTVAVSIAWQALLLFVLGSVISTPPFERYEWPNVLRNRYLVFGLVVACHAAVSAPLLLLSQRLRRARRTAVGRVPIRLGRSVAVLTLIGMTCVGVLSARGLSDKLDPLFREWFRRYLNSVIPQTVFAGNVDLNRKLHPYVQHNQDRIVIRAFSEREPGYLRGFVYESYQAGRWAGVPPTQRMHTVVDDSLASSQFFHAPEDVARPRPAVDRIEVHPARLQMDHLVVPAGTYQLEMIADGVQTNRSFEVKPRGLDPGGGYTVHAPSAARSYGPQGGEVDRESCLAVPEHLRHVLEPHLAALGAKETFRGKVAEVCRYLLENYSYALERQPDSDVGPIETFLDQSKRGHCELFATSALFLLRSQGVPARYVTGYVCREPHPLESGWVARMIDCHAWVEAWSEQEQRWHLVEATPPAGIPRGEERSGLLESIVEFASGIWLDLFAQVKRGYFAEAILRVLSAIGQLLQFFLITGPWFIGWPVLLAIVWWLKRRLFRLAGTDRPEHPLSESFRLLEKRLQPYAGGRLPHQTAREYIASAIAAEAPDPAQLLVLVAQWERIRYGDESAELNLWEEAVGCYCDASNNPGTSM